VLEIGRTALRRFASSATPDITWVSFAAMLATLLSNVAALRYESRQHSNLMRVLEDVVS
jgi:hypothetical protein